MPKIQDKYRSKLIIGLKILVGGLGLIYIFDYLSSLRQTEISHFEVLDGFDSILMISALISLSLLNWFGEIKKWQSLTGNLSFICSAKQSLISHGFSLFTPQKLGEYGGKCLFYPKNKHYTIIAYTIIGHFTQLLSTLVFGTIGIFILFSHFNFFHLFDFKWSWTALVLPVIFLIKPVRLKLKKILLIVKSTESQKIIEALGWAIFRYIVFAHQFYLLIILSGIEIPYIHCLSGISLVYLLAALMPVISIADLLVKGSLVITVFGLLGYNGTGFLFVVFLMWTGNTLLPAVTGYFWMLKWQPKLITEAI